MDDEIRSIAIEEPLDGGRGIEVVMGPRPGQDLDGPTATGEGREEGSAETARRSGDGDPHGYEGSASPTAIGRPAARRSPYCRA